MDTRKKSFDLMFGHLGNGITVCNRLKEVGGDYEKVAHIGADRKVRFYMAVPQEIRLRIEMFAREGNPQVSTTQEVPVFFSNEV